MTCSSIRTLQLRLYRSDIVLLVDLDHAVDLRRGAHQFDRARIRHARGGVAVVGEPVEEDIRDSQAAGSLVTKR